ncbi:MAG: sigma-70 family RNA polymerase sigma factor [Gimesia sp.]
MKRYQDAGSTSAGLIDRVRCRDEQAWGKLVDLYGPLIYSWCRRSGLRAEDAADIVQNVYCSVCNGLNRFEKKNPGDSFRAWLRIITVNQLRDYFRRQQIVVAQGGSDAAALMQNIPISDEDFLESTSGTGGLVERALDVIRHDFEKRTWESFLMTALQGYSSRETADELGISPNAVRKAKARVLSRLRQELGDCF